EVCKYFEQDSFTQNILHYPVFPTTRKISRLLVAVAALAVSSSGMIPPLEMTGSGMVSYIRYTVFTDVALSVCHHLKTHQSILRLWRDPSLRACMIRKEA
ncbi:hypothetical protein, partial [Dialister succinatiphilus]|uniref:hypothetical protein n=1 Tax=Dialister succinatiphilus TaxID=487173 RepID=UPI0040256ED5